MPVEPRMADRIREALFAMPDATTGEIARALGTECRFVRLMRAELCRKGELAPPVTVVGSPQYEQAHALFKQEPKLSLEEVAEAVGITPKQAHNIKLSLIQRGLLPPAPKRKREELIPPVPRYARGFEVSPRTLDELRHRATDAELRQCAPHVLQHALRQGGQLAVRVKRVLESMR